MSTASETFVALGAIDPELATPFLAGGQRLVLDPTAEDLAAADAAIVRAVFTVDKAMLDRMPALKSWPAPGWAPTWLMRPKPPAAASRW